MLDQNLNFTVDSSGVDPTDVESRAGGNAVNKVGWYHWVVTDIKNDTPTDKVGLECLKFDLQVVGANKDAQDQIGRFLYHRVYLQSWQPTGEYKVNEKGERVPVKAPGELSEGSRNLVLRFALGIGLIRQEQIGQQLNIPWAAAMDRQGCSTVEEDSFTNDKGEEKTSYKIPFNNVFSVLSDEFQHHIVVNQQNQQYVQIARAAAGQQVQQQPAPQNFGPAPGQGQLPQSPAQPQYPQQAPPQQAPPQQAPFGQPAQQIPQGAPQQPQLAPIGSSAMQPQGQPQPQQQSQPTQQGQPPQQQPNPVDQMVQDY